MISVFFYLYLVYTGSGKKLVDSYCMPSHGESQISIVREPLVRALKHFSKAVAVAQYCVGQKVIAPKDLKVDAEVKRVELKNPAKIAEIQAFAKDLELTEERTF